MLMGETVHPFCLFTILNLIIEYFVKFFSFKCKEYVNYLYKLLENLLISHFTYFIQIR